MAVAVATVLVFVVMSFRLVSQYRWRMLPLRLLTGTHPQRAALQRALVPVLREFLPLLDKAGQEVRAIVLVPTLSGSDGQPVVAEVEQLSDERGRFVGRLGVPGLIGSVCPRHTGPPRQVSADPFPPPAAGT